MSSFLYKSFRRKKLVLIIALLFTVYNSYARITKGIGQQKPVKITGLLAVSLVYFDAARANIEQFEDAVINSHTVVYVFQNGKVDHFSYYQKL